MSNLLNVGLYHATNILRIQSSRLLPQIARTSPYSTVLQLLRKTRCAAAAPASVGRLNYCTAQRAYDLNTSVSKDVILFNYENPRFFKMLNIFAICQFVFWNYLSWFAFTTLRDAPPPVEKSSEELKWYERINLGDNKYRNTITIFCFMIGYGVLVIAWTFTLRSVRFLILRKGGKDVSFVTYGPFDRNRILTTPLKCVSAEEARSMAKVHLPIKVKNRALYYVLDMRGEFRNPQLFDYTAGLKRRLE